MHHQSLGNISKVFQVAADGQNKEIFCPQLPTKPCRKALLDIVTFLSCILRIFEGGTLFSRANNYSLQFHTTNLNAFKSIDNLMFFTLHPLMARNKEFV